MPTTILTLPRPHPGQAEVLQSNARYRVLACGRRFGKTILGINELVKPALGGRPVAYFVPTFPMLTEVWRECLFRLQPVISRKSGQEHRIELITGGVIDFWSLDNPDGCRGRKYARVVIDEAAHIRNLEEAWLKVIRPTLTDYEGDAYFLSTPKGRNFFWECFQKGKNADAPDWHSWQLPTTANPYIKASEVEAARAEVPKAVFSQEYLAEFLEVGGRFFDGWEESRHVVQDRDIPAHWFKWGSLDGGTAAPFSFHLHAADEDGGVHTFAEIYQAGMLPTAQASLVAALVRAKGIPFGSFDIAADSAMFPPKDPAERRGEYQIEAFWKVGLNCVRAVKNRIPGWTRMKEYIHKPGGWQVHRGACPNLIRTIPLMVYDERPGHEEDMDTTLEDHACDDVRYGFMTRPPLSASLPREKTEDEVAAEVAEAHRRRRMQSLAGHEPKEKGWTL